MKIAILIALEKYADSKIEGVSFADTNANRLAEVLVQHGFETENSIILVNELATKTAIESKIRRAIKSCLDDDVLYFYYAGHAYSRNSVNYLTCTDSDSSDLDNTAIRLDWLLTQFRDSDCQQIVFLMDSGENVFRVSDPRVGSGFIDETELAQWCESSANSVCFTASRPNEQSHASRKLKSGIWAHHIIEALNGKAPSALVDGAKLTSSSLQAYLVQSVSQTLTMTYSNKKRQTPCMYVKKANEIVLADFAEILAHRKAESNPYAGLIRSVSFWARQTSTVKSLSGFKKGYAIPDRSNLSSQTFVAKLAQEQVSQDLGTIFQQLKSSFKFKRTEICVTDQGDGTGTIITPYFNYSISVALDEENPSNVVWHRSVDSIKDSDKIFSDAFASVFAGVFDTVEFVTPNAVDLDTMIDSLEALEDNRITLEYDHDATCCNLSIEGLKGEIHVTKRSLRIVHPMPDAPSNLLRSFLAIQNALLGPDGVSMIPIESLADALHVRIRRNK